MVSIQLTKYFIVRRLISTKIVKKIKIKSYPLSFLFKHDDTKFVEPSKLDHMTDIINQSKTKNNEITLLKYKNSI